MSAIPAIDWPVAVKASAQTTRPGPRLGAAERAALVADLVALQPDALRLAAQLSELPSAPQVPTRVVGRRGWVEANVAAASGMPALAGDGRTRAEWNIAEKIRARVLAGQLGLGMGWVAGKIIGQFQPFGRQEMLFVGPNVVMAERELAARPRDFRLWVSLHEQTHRLQFAAAPWLRDHLTGLMGEVIEAEATKPATAKPVMERVSAVMSVLEGYAETIMDRVGTDVVPSVADLRAGMQRRRSKPGVERIVNKAIGLDVKLAQYRDGARFCTEVIEARGMAGLNRVFVDAGHLPTLDEIHDPGLWLRRLD